MLFRLANPIVLLLLVIPPLIYALWLLFPQMRPIVPSLRYSDSRLMRGLPTSWRVRLRYVPDVLRLLAWMLLVLALARPQSGRQSEIIRGQGIDIVLVMDISGSMRALDIVPSRLEGAKAQMNAFIQGREFDRVGVVVFAADAFHYVPPTLDYDFLARRINDIRLITDYGLENSTAIGAGIASAANMLRDSDTDSRVIVLLTDGSNNNERGISPLDAARAASALGIRVYTIGMGKTGFVAFPVDDFGNTQLQESDLDEETLQEIAQLTDGLYFRAEDAAGLQRTYNQIDALERSDIEQQVFVRWREQAGGLMLGALLLLLAERFLRYSVFQALP